MRKDGAIDFNSVVACSSVSRMDAGARVVRGHIVSRPKHCESDGIAAKWKARVVSVGNNVRDGTGLQVGGVLGSLSPVPLETTRATIDVETACLLADLAGPPYVLDVPRVTMPASWTSSSDLRRPLIRLHKAVPQLQQSSIFGHELADRLARDHGWLPVHDPADDAYFKQDSGGLLLVLSLCVDDWIFGG